MPTYPIQLKRSGTASATPSSLVHGELAINYNVADGKLFWKDSSNVIQSFTFQAYALSSHTHTASDITSGTLDAARIANDSITYAKLQNVSATDRLLGRSSAGSGDVEEITCTSFGRALLDDTSHAAQLTTLGAAPLVSPTFTGTVTVPGLTATAAILADDLSSTNSVVYSFDGDPNTGVGRAGADILTLVTAGSERVRVDASGNVGIGSGGEASNKITVAGTYPTSGTVTRAMLCSGQIPSGSTVLGDVFVSLVGTVAASFTCANLRHFVAGQGGFGASSAVTNQFGFVAESGLTGATNNYGFYSDIASASNRWNFYAAGSAKNYFNGETLIGTTTDNGAYLLQVNSQIYATNATIATSDARFKTNVEPLTGATAVIAALRPVAFDFIPHAERNFATERQVGLIAQEAQAALAGIDYADSVVAQCGDHLGLAYEKLVPVLIRALQESNARIAALEERNHA